MSPVVDLRGLWPVIPMTVLLMVMPAANASADLMDGLVGYWAFNENGGAIANDGSGHGNQGSVHGAQWTAGVCGSALLFDGSDYVDIPDASSLDLTGNVTIASWIRVPTMSYLLPIVYKGVEGSYNYYLATGSHYDGVLSFQYCYQAGGYGGLRGLTSLAPSQWYFVVGVRDGTVVRAYRNGVPDGTATVPSGALLATGNAVSIGGPWYGYSFVGAIDEVMIYNRALSATEVQLLYEQCAPEPDVTPPSAITDLAVASQTANSITLTWTAVGDDGYSGWASEYDIRYSTDDGSAWETMTQVIGEPAPHPAGQTETFAVTGLSPVTPYYFRMKVGDEVPNWSGASNLVLGATTAVEPFYFVHLTDLHLSGNGSTARFDSTIAYINQMSPPPAFVVITGDLVHYSGPVGLGSWADFTTAMQQLTVPWYTCPGNHDGYLDEGYDYYKYRTGFDLFYVRETHGLRLISTFTGMDTDWWECDHCPILPCCIDGIPEGGGYSDQDAAWLEARLRESGETPTVVLSHHPIVYCGETSAHDGEDQCNNGTIAENREETWHLLRDPNGDSIYDDAAKIVLSGHTHNAAQYQADNPVYTWNLWCPVNTNSAELQKPFFIVGDAACDMQYRVIRVENGEFEVRDSENFRDNGSVTTDWNPLRHGGEANGWVAVRDTIPAGRLHVYDEDGQHVGVTSGGGLDVGIPNAYYLEIGRPDTVTGGKQVWGERISVFLDDERYSYVVRADQDAVVTLTGVFYKSGGRVVLMYPPLWAACGATGEIEIEGTSVNHTLYWDDDGDGVVDAEIQPENVTCSGVPYPPVKLAGERVVVVGQEQTYVTSTSDAEGEDLYYWCDWGDGSETGWAGPYGSAAKCRMSHGWTSEGRFAVRIKAKDPSGHESDWSDTLLVTSAATGNRARFGVEAGFPSEYQLLPIVPTPLHGTGARTSIEIRYGLPSAAHVVLVIYNVMGEEVTRLVGGSEIAGFHTATWDATGVAAGIYLCRLEAGGVIQTRKFVVLH